MKPEDFVGRHFGLLVDSIEDSIEYFENAFGMSFLAPARIPFVVRGHGDEWTQPTRAVYDTGLQIELVEVTEKGPMSRDHGVGLHHYGGLVTDLDAAVEEQQTLGNEIEWQLSYEGQLIAVFFRGAAALPGRLELVSAQAPPLESFAEGSEKAPAGVRQ